MVGGVVTLTVSCRTVVGPLDLDVSFEVARGEVVALIGPNGAGKTSLLRVVAGLRGVEEGRVSLDGDVLVDSSEGMFVAPEARPVGTVFQDYLLFPHLSVLENVAFGLRSRGIGRREARTIASAWIERVGLASYAAAKPTELSGGQSQRVALARALAVDPDVLLLDEPLAALDAATRAATRRDLRSHLERFDGATLLVTHDPLDALALADRVVVLEAGQVTQAGTIGEVVARPRTPYVAELLGVNLLRGEGSGHEVRLDGGGTVAVADPVEGPALVLIRPRSVTLHHDRPEGSARNRWRSTVDSLDLMGDRVRVRLSGEPCVVAEVTTGAVGELGLVEGAEVWATVKATDVTAYPS
ncbi:MAG: ABC transporter ATP-binding protein [Acidimicrobiales bacterium]|nr:ABC transporter ATP-binding protein [Acidimicrobiales bacterium]